MTVQDVLKRTGPRKLLALDGGGIRGLITIEVLAEIEAQLRAQAGQESLVLGDYFDYIGGTSTGAIIATCLSLGMSVDDVRAFYLDSGKDMFDKASVLKRYHMHKFEDERLAAQLQQVVGKNTTLGTDRLRTLLLIVMRNATTDSPWPVTNNPRAKFNAPSHPFPNAKLPLWQLIRASTAAPVYFPPEVIDVGDEEPYVFQDGGVTMYNNPAFLLFLMATIEPYKLQWPAGREQMLLVSIGTGTNPKANATLRPDEMNLIYNASAIPSALMFGALNEQDTLCRVFGDCRHGAQLDLELGDLRGVKGPVDSKLFTYVRYNAELARGWLDEHGFKDVRSEDVQRLDSTEHMAKLTAVGEAVAADFDLKHFEGFI